MGHTEMMLAVAGLDKNAVLQRLQCLAEGDWSPFSPAERAAFRFACKQATAPASIGQDDFDTLVRHFGQERAIDVVWWSSRCHYMTRIADAFGLPLERQNVFDGFLPLEATAKSP